MEIPNSYIIKDIRTAKDLKGITLCGYKRKDVIKAFQNSIINNKLEDSIRWCVELHVSCLNSTIWNILKNIYIKYIHINSPKFFIYLSKREKDYNNIINKYPKGHEIYTRNNQEIRNLYSELVSISTLTKKSNIFLPKSLPTINQKSFEKNDIKQRMIATNTDNIIEFVYNTTTSEMKLALNEIYTNLLLEKGTYENCIYWYLWIEKIENNKKKDKEKNNEIVFTKISTEDNKYFDHWIFILWKIIFKMKNKLEKNNLIYLKKIYNIYKKNFKISQINQKKYYIFIAFYSIKYKINWSSNIFIQEHLIIQSTININKMYGNVINKIESKLSSDTLHNLHKSYKKLYYDMQNKQNNMVIPQKMIINDLNDEINKVLFTKYPDYNFNKNQTNAYKNNSEYNNQNTSVFTVENESKYLNEEINSKNIHDELISKNMTKKDIIGAIEEKKNKKLDAFTQFIAFKKNDNKNKKSENLESNISNIESDLEKTNYYESMSDQELLGYTESEKIKNNITYEDKKNVLFLEKPLKNMKEFILKKSIIKLDENKNNDNNDTNQNKNNNQNKNELNFLEDNPNNKNLIDYLNISKI